MDGYFVFTNCYMKRLRHDVITCVDGEFALLQMSYNLVFFVSMIYSNTLGRGALAGVQGDGFSIGSVGCL